MIHLRHSMTVYMHELKYEGRVIGWLMQCNKCNKMGIKLNETGEEIQAQYDILHEFLAILPDDTGEENDSTARDQEPPR